MFGSIQKIQLGNVEHLPFNQIERFKAIEAARLEMERIIAAQRVKIASTTRAKSVDAFIVPPGDSVLVFREFQESGKDRTSCTSMTTTRLYMSR